MPNRVNSITRSPARHICRFAVLILACMPGSAQTVAVQTDWSAGGGKPGPALSWQQAFAASQRVAWRAIPGQLALIGQALAVPERHLIADDIDMPRFAGAGDLNGDGRTDIVTVDPIYSVTEKKGAIWWWRRLPGGAWTRRPVSLDFYGAEFAGTADVDRDGDLDVIAAAYYGDAPGLGRNGRFAWFENLDGDGKRWTPRLVGNNFWGASLIDAGDVDGDGDIDLVGASELTDGVYEQDADIAWFENLDGKGTQWALHSLDDDLPDASEAYFADLDADGDLDVVAANAAPNGPSTFWWYQNVNGDGSLWQKASIPGEFWGSGYLHVGDIDGDRDLDLIGGGFNTGVVGFWENLDGSGRSWQAWTVTSISGGTGIRLADLDGDGDLDALAAADNEIFWAENSSGNGYSWTKHTLLNGFTARTSAVPADVNHDGRLDAVMTDEDAYPPFGNQLTWFDLTTFAPKGVLFGTILDGGATPAWGPFAWEATVPDGTALKVEVRAGNTPAQLGAWVQVPRPGADLRTLIDPAARFLQYRLTMLTTNPVLSPVVRRLGINGLFLDGPHPGLAGQQNLLSAIWREPGARIRLFSSFQTGFLPVDGCPGLTVGLGQPVRIGELTTGADGTARTQFQAPPAGTLLPLFFQAVETGTCTVSDLVEAAFH